MNVAGVELHVEGLQGDGAETIVMIHGWPDTHRLWDAQVEALKGRYRCVRFTQPGFGRGSPRRAYTIDEITAIYRQIVDAVSPGQPVILLLHDWGCVFGYEFYMRNQDRVSKIVGVDIGDPTSIRSSLTGRELFGAFAYQYWLALAWIVGGRFGDWMTRVMSRTAKCPSDEQPMNSGMDWPYYTQWFGGAQSFRKTVQRFMPACPMLFLYGRRKPVRFHAKSWADAVAAIPGNEVVPFETGHWVMLQEPARFNEVVVRWLAQSGHNARPATNSLEPA